MDIFCITGSTYCIVVQACLLRWFLKLWTSYKDGKKDDKQGDGHEKKRLKEIESHFWRTEYSSPRSHQTPRKIQMLNQETATLL